MESTARMPGGVSATLGRAHHVRRQASGWILFRNRGDDFGLVRRGLRYIIPGAPQPDAMPSSSRRTFHGRVLPHAGPATVCAALHPLTASCGGDHREQRR